MMKITLLGDSIRLIGYGKEVQKFLGDEFEVYQPLDNCRFAKYTLRGLFDWEKDMRGSRIVHWNNGLWDVCRLFDDGCFSTEQEYAENMLRVADILLNRYDKVIFATTTPVTHNNMYDNNTDIERYNKLIVPLLEEKRVIINDLYALVSENIDEYISKEDNIHLTEKGITACAKQVARIIKDVAETIGSDYSCNENTLNANAESNGVPV